MYGSGRVSGNRLHVVPRHLFCGGPSMLVPEEFLHVVYRVYDHGPFGDRD